MTTDKIAMPLSKDDLSFATSSSQSPLRHFKGTLMDFNPVMRGGTPESPRQYNVIELDFGDPGFEVIESTVPYALKTAQLVISHSSSDASVWGVLGNSIEKFLGEGAKVSAAVAHVLEMKWRLTERLPDGSPLSGAISHMMRRQNRDTQAWEDQEIECWEVVSVNGKAPGGAIPSAVEVATGNANDILVEIADGKNAAVFNQAAMMDARVKTNTDLVMKIVNEGDAVLTNLIDQGLLTRDEVGVYHKVA